MANPKVWILTGDAAESLDRTPDRLEPVRVDPRRVLSDEPPEHRPHVGRDQVEVEQRRLDDLLPAECQ